MPASQGGRSGLPLPQRQAYEVFQLGSIAEAVESAGMHGVTHDGKRWAWLMMSEEHQQVAKNQLILTEVEGREGQLKKPSINARVGREERRRCSRGKSVAGMEQSFMRRGAR